MKTRFTLWTQRLSLYKTLSDIRTNPENAGPIQRETSAGTSSEHESKPPSKAPCSPPNNTLATGSYLYRKTQVGAVLGKTYKANSEKAGFILVHSGNHISFRDV